MSASINLSFLLFGIHGFCYFYILWKLRGAGVKVNAVVDVSDAITYYRIYFREAATRGWSRLIVYLSIVSLLAGFISAVYWVLNRPAKSKPTSSAGSLIQILETTSQIQQWEMPPAASGNIQVGAIRNLGDTDANYSGPFTNIAGSAGPVADLPQLLARARWVTLSRDLDQQSGDPSIIS